ncbi:hypothetical protein Bca4012_096153 [Brassica carinata]
MPSSSVEEKICFNFLFVTEVSSVGHYQEPSFGSQRHAYGGDICCHLDLFLVGGKFKILLMVEDATGRRKRITDLAIEMEVGFRVMINRLVVCLSFVLGSILESDPSTCPAEMYR